MRLSPTYTLLKCIMGLPALFLPAGQSTDTWGRAPSPVRLNSSSLLFSVGVNLEGDERAVVRERGQRALVAADPKPGVLLHRGLQHPAVNLHHRGREAHRGEGVRLARDDQG